MIINAIVSAQNSGKIETSINEIINPVTDIIAKTLLFHLSFESWIKKITIALPKKKMIANI